MGPLLGKQICIFVQNRVNYTRAEVTVPTVYLLQYNKNLYLFVKWLEKLCGFHNKSPNHWMLGCNNQYGMIQPRTLTFVSLGWAYWMIWFGTLTFVSSGGSYWTIQSTCGMSSPLAATSVHSRMPSVALQNWKKVCERFACFCFPWKHHTNAP